MTKLNFLLSLYFYGICLQLSSGFIFGVDQSSLNSYFVKLDFNSSKVDRFVDLGRMSISGPSTATRSCSNKNYLVTCYTSDSLGVPHYFFLNIDISQTPKLIQNVTLNGPGLGSFWQIADDDKQIIGIRESVHSGSTLEVASIDQTNGLMKSIGFYPYGQYSLVMTFAKQHRLYYNLIESYRFCAINVDTGRLDIDINIPYEYTLYGIIYDSLKDRLLTIVQSSKLTVENSWVLAQMTIHNDSLSSTNISFQRIGNSSIPMSKGYFWTTTSTLSVTERQWITKWNFSNEDKDIIISFNIDSGDIIQNQTIQNCKDLTNIVYFD